MTGRGRCSCRSEYASRTHHGTTRCENPVSTREPCRRGPIAAMTPGPDVAATLLRPSSQLLGAGVLGANYNGAGEPESSTGSELFTFDSFNSGELYAGFVSANDLFDANPPGFMSMTLTLDVADGGTLYDHVWSFDNLTSLDSFLTDKVLDLGYATDPAMTIGLSYDLTADGNGGLDFGFAFATGVPPASTPLPGALPLFVSGLGALGLLGWRRRKKAAAAAP